VAQATAGTQLATTWAQPHARVATSVRVDWNRDGDWSDPYEDITPRVISVTIRHQLYDQLSGLPLLGQVQPSSAEIVVANDDRWLSVNRAGGVASIYPGVAAGLYRIPIRVELGYYAGTTAERLVQFVGEIEGGEASELYGQGTITLSCVDNSIRLLQYKRSTPVRVGWRADELIEEALVAGGVTAYELDTGMTRIPYAWSDDENAYEECRLAAAADGGMFYFGKDGKALFRRMTAPIERGHSRTVQATLDQGNTRELTDSIAWRDVYSSVIVEWAGRYQAPITDLWTAPRAIEIPPGKTVTEEARYRYPAATVYAPVYGYDYHAMTMAPAAVPYGTGGLTVQTTAYGQRARIAMTNHGTVNTIYVSDLRLRGLPLVGDEAQEQRWEQTAGLVPGEKTYALRGNPLIQTADQAGRVGPYLRDRLQRPQRLLTWSGPGIPWVELLDRVRVSHRTMTPNPGVDLEAYVVGIEMDTSGGAWAQTLTLLPATGCFAYSDYFRVGVSHYADSGSDRLGY
jgi:hypothetical protein